MVDYDGLARYYDAEWQDLTQDMAFLREIAAATGGPVLELASGTGRILFPLAEDGHEVWGIDNSQEMLSVHDMNAKKLSPEVQEKIHVGQQEMQSFSIDQKFKLIIIPFNSFLLLTDRADFDRCLQNCRRHLLPGGRLLVDIYSPNFALIAEKEPKMSFLRHFYSPSIERTVIQWEYAKRDMAEQCIDIDFLYEEYDAEGNLERSTQSITMSIIFRYEMQYLLEKNGFSVKEFYGNYDRSEFTADSPQMIYVCERVD